MLHLLRRTHRPLFRRTQRCRLCGQRTRNPARHWWLDHAGDTGVRP